MISSYRRLMSAFALAALPVVAPAAAQTSDPGKLQHLIKTGETIAIVDLNGSETRGLVERIGDGVLELHPILPGETSNEYRTVNAIRSYPIDQIAGLSRVDAFGGNPELVYQRLDSFGTLQQRLKPGQLVRVIERSGTETVGKVTGVSASALVLTIRKANPRDGSGRPRHEWDGLQTFTPSAVEKVERPAHLWDGAVKGAAVALAIVGLTAASTCSGDCYGIGPFLLMSGAIGAGAGFGIDALFGPKRLYRAPRPK